MNKSFCMDNNYNTTRLCYKLLDNKFLEENGKIKEEYKFKLNIPELGIIDSKIPAKKEEKFDTYLFLPEGEGRKGEGGLRTKGLSKFNYKLNIMNSKLFEIQKPKSKIQNSEKWYISDFYGNPIKPAPENIQNEINNHLNNNNSKTKNQNPKLNQLPLISIITVVFNGKKYLEETIQSVINQTYPNVEYIIIDGGSTDGTLEIIKKYENYIDYWVSEKDNGIYDAMNKGLKLAFGKFIGILNADDYYEKDAIESLVLYLLETKKDYVVANVKIIEKNSVTKPIFPLKKNKIYQEMPYPHVGALIPIEIYKKVGLFSTKFKIAGDHDIALRIHLDGYECCYLNKIVANIHVGGTSDCYRSNFEFMKVAISNRKNFILAYFTFLKQLIKLFLAKSLPDEIVKKFQKFKKSRYYD